MATVNAITSVPTSILSPIPNSRTSKLVTWETLTSANADGQAIAPPNNCDFSFQATGTFDSATVTVQGSNDNGTTWYTLTTTAGAAATATAPAGFDILDLPAQLRVFTSDGGGSQDIDAFLIIRVRQ